MPERTQPLAANAGGVEVENLHLSLRRLGAEIPAHELEARMFGHGTVAAVRDLQRRFRLPPTGEVDNSTAAAVAVAVEATTAPGESVFGRVYLEDGRVAAGLPVFLYGRGFGGKEVRLGEVQTNADGFYAISYEAGERAAGIELRTAGPDGEELRLSKAKYEVQANEVLNVVAPKGVQPLDAEFDRLMSDLGGQLEDLALLAKAREAGDQRDLTLLRQATGWDARIVGLAARASRLEEETGAPQAAIYALLRAGLPADPQKLALVPSETVGKALAKAKEAGVVSLSEGAIKKSRSAFESFAARRRLTVTAPGTASPLGDLLERAPVAAADRKAFEQVFFEHRGAPEQLWESARANGVSEAGVDSLRLQGKLAYLTLNNALLTQSLQEEIGSVDGLVGLVEMGLYSADAWTEKIKQVSGGGAALDKFVPPAYGGEKPTDRLDAYAADLARKVRLSFPTQVVGQMVANDELDLGEGHQELRAGVASFLKQAPDHGYELGRAPVEGFVREHGDAVFGNATAERRTMMLESVKTLDRLYQITPSDHALQTLLNLGFKSAYDVRKFDHLDFVDKFDKFFRPGEAALLSRKADQVAAVTYTFYGAAKQLESAPPIYAAAPQADALEEAKNDLIKHYPTMESLFGSLDFCECEHCRSVLSPAAYLVDLLQFVNPDKLLWDSFLARWKTTHNNASYTAKYAHPYDALIERRPDLANLPLTCENTNTALPYIDVVNEMLEHYIADGAPKAYDTGDATTPELLAEPQNVVATAYGELQKARYPIGLPFDLWTETVRAFFDHFQAPLWKVLELFRPAETTARFTEPLGLTPVEHEVLTGSDLSSKWYELYGLTSAATAKTELSSAKRLSRRLGVTYKQLIELVTGGFVNPRLHTVVVLRKLDIEVTDVFRYKGHAQYTPLTAVDKAAFEDRLAELSQEYPGFDAKAWLNAAYSNGQFDEVVVLADPDAGCDFDKTILRYADGTAADPILFLKLNVLVRLWRRLGWTIAEVDRGLEVFVPSGSQPLTAAKLADALGTALVYMAHLNELAEKVPAGKNTRLKLLTLWSSLSTSGKNPLYAQLFLTRSVLKNDPAFDDALGNYLSRPNVPVKDHLLGIQGALNLTADDVDRILADAGQSLEGADLSLELVSLLYRYALLAKGLKISVRELVALKALTGLDPMKPLAAAPLASPADDHPLNQTLAFVDAAAAVRDSGFSAEDLEYLLRHRTDPVGPYRDDPAPALALVRTLGAEVRRVTVEHAIPRSRDELVQLTDDVLRQRLALIYPPEVVDTFLAMWTGGIVYEAIEENVAEADALKPAEFASRPEISVSYDPDTKVQVLRYRGILLGPKKAQLAAAHPSAVLARLLDAVQAQAKEFFERELDDFLTTADFNLLFAPVSAQASEKDKEDAELTKRRRLAEAFLPYLRRRLIRQLAVRALATELDSDPATTEALITDVKLLEDPTVPGSPLLDAFAATGERGVTVAFYGSDDVSGNPLAEENRADADSAGDTPAGTKSVRLAAHVEVPVSGTYHLFVGLDKKDAEAELRLGHLPDPVLVGVAGDDGSDLHVAIELTAGVPYGVEIVARKLGGGNARLRIKAGGLPKGPLSRLTLHPAAVIERVARARALVQKVIMLMVRVDLGERELRYLVAHPEDFGSLDLNSLPTIEDGGKTGAAALANAQARFGWLSQLIAYARLKREAAAPANDLVDVLERARRVHPSTVSAADAGAEVMADLCARFGAITRREPAVVADTAAQLGIKPSSTTAASSRLTAVTEFATPAGLRRLWDALSIVERLGVPVASIAGWAKVVTATPDEQAAIAKDLRNTAKARYEPEAWQRVAQPIFDVLRRRQRDALVAFVMQQGGFERLEELFEYFLVDPGMEPVVQTSRIQLAIASVQLFVQRCLLNLEPKVHPAALVNAKHWDWMKRHRVWEANRKIFLFPENWLEPEFRDDKSNLFQELEGALLQGDMSTDLAETAFFTYLQGLGRIARLDVVSMYVEEQPDPVNNVLHVIGRTHSRPYQYHYRRYAHQTWMPWEPIDADIESDHVAVVVWRGRLHVFWVTFMEMAHNAQPHNKTIADLSSLPASSMPAKRIEFQLHWTERFQGQWTTREAGANGNPVVVPSGVQWQASNVMIYVTKEYGDGEERAVRINLGGLIGQCFRLVSKNSPPQPDNQQPQPLHPYSAKSANATKYTGRIALSVDYTRKIHIEDGTVTATTVKEKILDYPGYFDILRPSKALELPNGEVDRDHVAALVAPFFFIGADHTFYVEPELRQKTMEYWEHWAIDAAPQDPVIIDPGIIDDIYIVPEIPELILVIPKGPWPDDPLVDPVDPYSEFELDLKDDWITNPGTLLEFDGGLVGHEGFVGIEVVTGLGGPAGVDGEALGRGVVVGGARVPGGLDVAGEVDADDVLVMPEGRRGMAALGLGRTGEHIARGGTIAVVGTGGVNPMVLENVATQLGARPDVFGLTGLIGGTP